MWGVVASAVIASAAGAYNASRSNISALQQHTQRKVDDLAREIAEHKLRMAAEHRKTIRQANVLTVLLLAFIVTATVGILQLFGVV